MANTQSVTLACNQGSTERFVVTFSDEAGTPVNITGCTFQGMVREDFDSSVVASFSFTILSAAEGKFEMVLSAAQTAALDVSQQRKRFVFDVEMTAANGDKSKILIGYLNVLREVTR